MFPYITATLCNTAVLGALSVVSLQVPVAHLAAASSRSAVAEASLGLEQCSGSCSLLVLIIALACNAAAVPAHVCDAMMMAGEGYTEKATEAWRRRGRQPNNSGVGVRNCGPVEWYRRQLLGAGQCHADGHVT